MTRNDNSKYKPGSVTAEQALNMGLRIINPNHQRKPRAFPRLNDKAAAIFTLHLAGFKHTYLLKIFKTSSSSITYYVTKGFQEYPELLTCKI